ncbi:conserved hypothetical protein [Perkinsus marinus ATCC 50983]|uniref:Uncharacterized protein n=1 Tax=Perkinsus marinus (strain ATCC 50983 / TXsc) TaxID=423536 RepID=C5LP64_PERM5|nr:conserved hypothetical protein [Perkinsus marinus ATCC 50983]EER01483.1 conserved hypothetical protein [Perkinsus marinus ATCC 50983]|eukprot:XP_002768765.1 conserved hypothetical protein [Perkinsus marinus ATCC 50983]
MHRSTNREAGTAEEISEKFRPVLTSKDDTIFELQEEQRKLQEAHAQLVRAFEAKLGEYGIPREEMGFDPKLLA